MNILIFSWRGPGHPKAGGAEEATYEHAKGWVNMGHKVTLFTSRFTNSKPKETKNGVEIIRSGHEVFGVQIAALFWYLLGRHPEFDLVVDEFHGIPFFTPIYVRTRKLGWIHEVAGEVWKLNPWPKPFNLIPYIIGTLFEPLIFKLFYKKIPFMTVSESTKNDLIQVGIPSKNIFIVRNGFTSIKVKVKKEKVFTIMFLGALSKDKGIEEAIKVFSLIDKSGNNFNYWVVGKSDLRYLFYLKKLANRLGIYNKIRFFGFVNQKTKFNLLAKSHILLNTSLKEGWGLVNIEANSVGTPVVAFNVPGCRDSVKPSTGALVRFQDLKKMSQTILKIEKSQKTYKRLSENAKKWSTRFSWEGSNTDSLNLIKRITK